MLSQTVRRSFSTSAANAVKITARDAPGNLTSVSVVVQNAGAKASGKAGLSHLASKFNFLNTASKSALRFTRESELLGGSFTSTVGRDSIVLNAKFLKQDLPFYVEHIGNVVAQTSFRPHEYTEVVLPAAKAEYEAAHSSNEFTALENLHELSFRKGLGNPLYYDGSAPISLEEVQEFAAGSYTTGNVSIFASGANSDDLTKFVSESAFAGLPAGSSSSTSTEIFKGKESRTRAAGESVALIGVPVQVADFAKFEVLSAAVGNSVLAGNTPLSKIPGATSFLYKYQDAGLFVVSVKGAAADVAQGIKQAKKVVDSVSSTDLTAAVKSAELSIALQDTFEAPLSVKVDASAASGAALGEFNYVAIGNVDILPYANEL